MITIMIILSAGWVITLLVLIGRTPDISDRVRCLCCDEQVEPRDINPGNGMCPACQDAICREARHPHIEHDDL